MKGIDTVSITEGFLLCDVRNPDMALSEGGNAANLLI